MFKKTRARLTKSIADIVIGSIIGSFAVTIGGTSLGFGETPEGNNKALKTGTGDAPKTNVKKATANAGKNKLASNIDATAKNSNKKSEERDWDFCIGDGKVECYKIDKYSNYGITSDHVAQLAAFKRKPKENDDIFSGKVFKKQVQLNELFNKIGLKDVELASFDKTVKGKLVTVIVATNHSDCNAFKKHNIDCFPTPTNSLSPL